MTRTIRVLICLLPTVLLLTGHLAEAQQPGKIFRIGYLDLGTASGNAVLVDAFRQELNKLGWIEGKNITIENRFSEGKLDRIPDLAAELVRLKVDVIVTGSNLPTRSAKKATATIPIVMAQDPDPVGNGFVVSLARPGGNVTGLASLSNELNTKRLEILKDTVPSLTRVGILRYLSDTVQSDLTDKELNSAALALKVKLEQIKTQPDLKGLEFAFQSAKQKQVDAIMTSAGRRLFGERKRIVELAGKYRLPAIYIQKEFVDEGGLMSYGTDYVDLFRSSAHYVDRSSKDRNLPTCPFSRRRSLNSSSTSRRQNRLA